MSPRANISETSSEDKILQAAEEIFLRDGFDGARMQRIANEAGINKAMLHYYFRSKEKLFEKIFEIKTKRFFPDVVEVLENQELPFTEKMKYFVEKHHELLQKYPYLPLFILTTINKRGNEGLIAKFPKVIPQLIVKAYQQSLAKNEVKELDILHLIISVMGMSIFPFVGKPLITNMLTDTEHYKSLIKSRVSIIQGYLEVLLKP